MLAPARSQRARKPWLLLALGLAGVLLGSFFLLFMVVNDGWVAIHIPNLPWDPESGWAAFEARLTAVIGVSFVLGALCVVAVSRFLDTERRNRAQRDRARIDELESEIEKVSRLLSSSRDNG